jgi:hypothetical protein
VRQRSVGGVAPADMRLHLIKAAGAVREGRSVFKRVLAGERDQRPAAATLADHSHRADNRAASPSRTFLVRFSEGGVVECIEGSLDRPGQGRAMDVG